LSGLELHFMRRSSSCIRSSDGTSSRFAAISAAAAAATGRAARLCSCRCSAVEVGCSGSQLGRPGGSRGFLGHFLRIQRSTNGILHSTLFVHFCLFIFLVKLEKKVNFDVFYFNYLTSEYSERACSLVVGDLPVKSDTGPVRLCW
jgi:hypothetical protein